jgi:hypothetical protein
MWERDLLVAIVACGLGGLLLIGGVSNSDRCFGLPTPQYLTAKLGRTAARCILASIGVVLIALGCRIGLMSSTPKNSWMIEPASAGGAPTLGGEYLGDSEW